MAARAKADEAYHIVSTALDQAFYRATNPDLAGPGFDPVRHYLDHGWREGRDPAPWFSVRRYLEVHPDVAAGGEDPLTHYMRYGVREGREAFPSERTWRPTPRWTYEPNPIEAMNKRPEPPGPLFSEADREIVAREFDAEFYRDINADVVEAGADPLEHFLAFGWREGRDPTRWFSVRDYLRDNPDIEEAGVNPFAHYLTHGRAEGRSPRNKAGFRFQIIAGLTSLDARIDAAAERAAAVEPSPAGDFLDAITGSRTGLKDVHITFSHDDFNAHIGGVQLCLQYEAAEIARLGRDHLHLCPATPWLVLRRGQPSLLTAILNGRAVGAFSARTVAEGLAAARRQGGSGSFALHNLLGHSVDEVLEILEAAKLGDGFFWLHDFTSLCAGYQLLRNDVADCAAPPPDSAACGICFYGPRRAPQIAEHERLFRKLRLTVISPSQTTLDFWRSRCSYPAAGAVVHPHLRLKPRAQARPSEPGPLRVAFLGLPAAHKGWPIFAELAAEHASDPRYRFLHLGARRDPRASVEFHQVAVSLADPHAMRRAIEELQVDVAVVWSLFRETFCLAAYEAVAAGAALVTSPESANVAAFVQNEGHGRVLPDDAALWRAVAAGDLLDLARDVRQPMLYDLEFSGMTADLLAASVAA